jgi:cobalt/nickel transport system permease protein
MHMADALLSPAVGLTMGAVSAGAMALSVSRINKDDLSDKKVPLMAVSGAFVFAAQMINFTIPATGSSGHIGGGMLLAALLGGYPSFLTLSVVLIIQALFFADGGLLALGCNIFNMGLIPCLLVYPLVFRPLLKRGVSYKSLTLASILSVVSGLQLGSLGVVLETAASGVTELPLNAFLLVMQPIHLAIGLVEGIITAAILGFVHRMRPDLVEAAQSVPSTPKVTFKKVLALLAVLTVLTGGILSLYASKNPDGLEWSIEKVAGTSELSAENPLHESAAFIQDRTALMPDYDYTSENSSTIPGTSLAGLIGGGLTFLLAGVTGLVLSRIKKKKPQFTRLRENQY